MHANVANKPAATKKMSTTLVTIPSKGDWVDPTWMQKQIKDAVGHAVTPQRSKKVTKSQGMQDYIRQIMGLNDKEVLYCLMTRTHCNQTKTKQQERTRQSRRRLRGETCERDMRKRTL